MHESGPFTLPAIRDFVPEKWKPWIMIAIVIVFQLSGGVYLASVAEMVGSLALLHEDIMMAGYASLVGMSLTFAIMFRLKFRFNSKVSLLTCCIVLIVCNLICMHTSSVPLLVATSFVAGIFRMWGTFECNSSIQLWLTPKRDLSVFFCYIYLLVNGAIQVTGLTAVYTAFLTKWEYMHWLVIGLLLLVMLAVSILFRSYRSMRKLPLFGIDWLGGLMWGITILCILFVCVYGEHYDWYESIYIKTATVGGLVVLTLNLWRASFIRHPYIALGTWRFKMVYLTLALLIVIYLLLAPSHLFEHILMESILGYDALHVNSLNWTVILGTATGALFTYQLFALRKWRYKTMTVIGFACILGYLAISYFTIDYNLPKQAFILPVFLRSFGYVIIAICFLTSLSRVPFQNFFQAVTIQSFVSAAFGAALGDSIVGHALQVVTKKNAMLLSAGFDHVNPASYKLPAGALYGALQQHALLVSMKELYGWLLMIGLFCLFVFMVKESSLRPKYAIHPKFRTIRRAIKHELREDAE